ncbi:MAG: 7-carboxy-7-deazaguanine synthase QueE [archaeon]|nr:7-carboxy-7-deazaguanine synthase QueE [archaeon]
MTKYKVNKIFYSLQGEGKRTGTPQVFLRFSGCNLKCSFCDTEHESHTLMTTNEILEKCLEVSNGCKNISFCGGEPTLQLTDELIKTFKGWYKSIETNGLKPVVNGIDYVVCSPKTKKIEPDNIDELRFVIVNGQKLPKINKKAKKYFLSPCFDGEKLNIDNLNYCIKIVKENPSFNLSIQSHKLINIE